MKKKNLLKCLALTSMLALSVGAVTSCGTQGAQGPKGDKGDKGETGAQGAQGAQGAKGDKGDKGDQGEKGDKGDSYYPVVIMSDGIKTDVVEGKAGDTYVLTFTAPAGQEIVSELVINYEEVELTEEIIKGTYTGTFSGAVVVSAKFGTVQSYGEGLIESYYNTMFDADHQLTKPTADSYKDLKVDKGSYGDDETQKERAAQKTAVATALSALKKDATNTEKVEAVKKVYDTAKTKLQEAYAKDVKKAKEEATEAATYLYTNYGSNYAGFKAADKDAMKTACLAEIAAADSLQDVVDAYDDTVGTISKAKLGKYSRIETLRQSAFDDVKSGLNAIKNEKDKAMFVGSTPEDNEKLDALKEELEDYGISVNKLPSEIKAEYDEKISAETGELEVYEKADSTLGIAAGETKIGYEGKKAISESYTSVKTELKKAIYNKYVKEINDSTKLTSSEAKNTLIGIVDGALGEWILKNDSTGEASIASYMDTTTPVDTTKTGYTPEYANCGYDKYGLVGYVETKFTKEVSAKYEAFGQERLTNAMNEVYKVWKENVASVEKDSLYKSLLTIDATAKDENGDVTGKIRKYYVSYSSETTKDFVVENPFYSLSEYSTTYKSSSTDKNEEYVTGKSAEETTSDISIEGSSGKKLGSVTKSGTWSASALLQKLAPVDSEGNASGTSADTLWALTDVASIKQVGQYYNGAFNKVYNAAVDEFKKTVLTELKDTEEGHYGILEGSENGYIASSGQVTIEDLFGSLMPQKLNSVSGQYEEDEESEEFSTFTKAAKTLVTANAQLVKLDADVAEWVGEKADEGILDDEGLLDKNTTMWEDTLDLTNSSSIINQVLSGSLKDEAIEKAVEELNESYETGVSSYGDRAKDYLEKQYTALHQTLGLDKGIELENVYAKIKNIYGYVSKLEGDKSIMGAYAKAYACESYSSIKNYYNAASWLMNSIAYGSEITTTSTKHVEYATLDLSGTLSKEEWNCLKFVAALAENGANISNYVVNNSSSYASESAAKTAVKNKLAGLAGGEAMALENKTYGGVYEVTSSNATTVAVSVTGKLNTVEQKSEWQYSGNPKQFVYLTIGGAGKDATVKLSVTSNKNGERTAEKNIEGDNWDGTLVYGVMENDWGNDEIVEATITVTVDDVVTTVTVNATK